MEKGSKTLNNAADIKAAVNAMGQGKVRFYALPEPLLLKILNVLGTSKTDLPFVEMNDLLRQLQSMKEVQIVEKMEEKNGKDPQ